MNIVGSDFDLTIAHAQIKRLDKIIDPTIDHEDQAMKVSSFFNTHTHKRCPFE
jgi:hypothetical protein